MSEARERMEQLVRRLNETSYAYSSFLTCNGIRCMMN